MRQEYSLAPPPDLQRIPDLQTNSRSRFYLQGAWDGLEDHPTNRMPAGASRIARWSTAIVVLTITVILAYAGVAARVTSIMDYDPAIGFLVWRSMEAGAPFNHLRSVSHSDLASDDSQFVAAYSPGQYIVPGVLTKFGITLRSAIWLTALLAVAIGLLGYFLLFRRVFGFPVWVAALSCLLLSLMRPVGALFFEYAGGTLLEFAGMPYIIIGAAFCLKGRTSWRMALPLIFLAGAFLKLSVAVLCLSICLCAVFIDLRDRKRSSRARILRAAAAVASFVLFYAVMGAVQTSRGWTAASAQRLTGITPSTVLFSGLYSVASLTSGITSVFSMLPPLKAPLDPAALTNSADAARAYLPILALLALASIGLIAWVVWRRPGNFYSRLLLALSFTSVASMSYIYSNAGARLEFRHFWLVGALLLPGLVTALSEVSGKLRLAAIMAGVLVCLFGVASSGLKAFQSAHAVKLGDFSYAREEKEIAAVIGSMEASDAHPTAVIFANDPRVALLARKSRLAFTSGTHFDTARYRGAVSSLVVIIETREVLEKTPPRITAMFPDMSNWRAAVVGPFTVLVGGHGAAPRAIADILRPLSGS